MKEPRPGSPWAGAYGATRSLPGFAQAAFLSPGFFRAPFGSEGFGAPPLVALHALERRKGGLGSGAGRKIACTAFLPSPSGTPCPWDLLKVRESCGKSRTREAPGLILAPVLCLFSTLWNYRIAFFSTPLSSLLPPSCLAFEPGFLAQGEPSPGFRIRNLLSDSFRMCFF